MTVDQIVAEARRLSSDRSLRKQERVYPAIDRGVKPLLPCRHFRNDPEQMAELLDQLAAELHGGLDSAIDDAWKTETRRRLADMERGRDPGIPGDEVMEESRRIVGR